MMHKRMPTQADIDALLAYLPLFEEPGRTYIKHWGGGAKLADGSITVSYPVYDEDVSRFFRLAAQDCWNDTDYNPIATSRILEDQQRVNTADIQDIRTMLTYCVRGERFCDGHWAAVLSNGQVQTLLRRLQELPSQSATP